MGSLYTAAGAYLDARAHGGRFLLRIEDLDRPREIAGSAARMLATLHAFGFEWDGPVVRQRERGERYAAALDALQARGHCFLCACSRPRRGEEARYPGTCRERGVPASTRPAVRVRVEPGEIAVFDRLQGIFRQDLAAAAGDFIVKRRDGIIAYVLAVVVDDAAQGVTDVVRGADLLESTPRQVYLQRLLGLPTPRYAHLPVLLEADGGKLAKSRRSVRLDADSAAPQLHRIFSLLGLRPPGELRRAPIATAWAWAAAHWDLQRVPARVSVPLADLQE